MPDWTCGDSIRPRSHTAWKLGNRMGLVTTFTLVAIPGQPIPPYLAQQLTTAGKETASGLRG
jgi:hypothetical protein